MEVCRERLTVNWVWLVLFFTVVSCTVVSLGISIAKADNNPDPPSLSTPASRFELSVRDGLVSLNARNASLKAIIEKIGEQFNISVVAHLSAEERVTDQFEGLSIEQALRRLTDRYATFQTDKGGKITRIVVYPKGEDAPKGIIEAAPSKRPEPFKFEFDPTVGGGSKGELK
jgi:hypothetical protein